MHIHVCMQEFKYQIGMYALCMYESSTSQFASQPLSHASQPLSRQSTFLARGCGPEFSIDLVGRFLSYPLPPWVTRRGEVWRVEVSHHLQYDPSPPPPSYVGPGEGGGQQQQYLHPCPPTNPACSMPLPLPPYCMTCSVHAWRGV